MMEIKSSFEIMNEKKHIFERGIKWVKVEDIKNKLITMKEFHYKKDDFDKLLKDLEELK